jgi:hypothetical protein
LPIPQKKPLGLSYFKLLVKILIPFACRAEAILSPSMPLSSVSLKKNEILLSFWKSSIGCSLIRRNTPRQLNIDSIKEFYGFIYQLETDNFE